MEERTTISQPKVVQREEQPYVGIRTQVPPSKFKKIIPEFLDELFAWLRAQGVPPAGAPFMRYYVINMAGNMDVELGVPVPAHTPLKRALRREPTARAATPHEKWSHPYYLRQF